MPDGPGNGTSAGTVGRDGTGSWGRRLGSLRRLALALVVGSAGGALLNQLGVPLAWMIGAMLATAAAALSGASIGVPQTLRALMLMVLGIMLGSGFHPAILSSLDRWLVTLAGLVVFILVCTAIGTAYLRRVARYDPATAFFTASPGGFSEMVLVGGAMGGDDRMIALNHSARLMLVVTTIPIWFAVFTDYTAGERGPLGPDLAEIPLKDYLMLGACAAGGPIARRLRFPAAWMVGPMLASAAIHLAGLTEGRPPGMLIAAAQVVIGSHIGCRFVGVPLRTIGAAALAACGLTALLLTMTVTFAAALHALTGIPMTDLVLAYAPGGFAEMSLIALALNVDVAFVSSHHLFRIMVIVVLAPSLYMLARRFVFKAQSP